MGAELPYQICEIGSICRMWRNTQNTHLPCSPISIHIFLAEGDVSNNSIYVVLSISIHTFLVEGDDVQYQITELTKISIHTFLTEGDVVSVRCAGAMVISIHTFLTEGDKVDRPFPSAGIISIHTFLTEGDAILPSWPDKHIHFNPHLPCRRWQQQQLTMCMIFLFQSTPSLQKVTTSLQLHVTH